MGVQLLRQTLRKAYWSTKTILADEFGVLLLRQATAPLSSPLPLYTGYWEPRTLWFARREVTPRLAEAFVDLGWFDAEPEAG